MFYEENVYADDLNAYRIFPATTANNQILESLRLSQTELHGWGKANQIEFEAGKESMHILSSSEGYGKKFKMLGVVFDVPLTMRQAVDELVTEAGWKLKMLIRTRRFYTNAELVVLYKSHLLSFLEYRSPAIYHAKREVLWRLDRIQSKFLDDAGLNEADALMEFNLAPLSARRDIAMMGVIHRAVLRKGPPHFRKHFVLGNGGKLIDPRHTIGGPLIARSALGLVAVYNFLPQHWKDAKDVKSFQSKLQTVMKERLKDNCEDWAASFSPRIPLLKHPLSR
jgi:hypothetical protein